MLERLVADINGTKDSFLKFIKKKQLVNTHDKIYNMRNICRV